jgi:Chaperone of endosialidase
MGGGGGSSSTESSGKSHEVKQIILPEWVQKAGEKNYGIAEKIADSPYAGYEDTLIPEMTGLTRGTLEEIVRQSNLFPNYWDTAGNYLAGVMGQGGAQWSDISRAMPAATEYGGPVSQYMSPYIENVENRAIANAERSGQLAQRGIDTEATERRSFGGSRHAVQKAIQGAETTRGIGDLSANLRQKAFESGEAARERDLARRFKNVEHGMMGQKAELERQISNQDMYREYSQGMLEIPKVGSDVRSKDYFNLLASGRQYEDKTREGLEEEYKKWKEEKDYPIEMLNLRLAALGMTPYGRTEITDKTESGTSKTKQKSGMDFGSLLSGGAGLLSALSDRNEKTNIEKLGTDPQTKLPIYAYDYKADVKGRKVAGPKRVGPMAQDVEKRYPQAVGRVAGKRVIDFTKIPMVA